MAPAIGVLGTAPLNAGEGIVQVLGHRADLATGDNVVLAAIAELANGGDDGCGAGAEGLLQGAVLSSLNELVYAELPLLNLIALVPQNL